MSTPWWSVEPAASRGARAAPREARRVGLGHAPGAVALAQLVAA
jgi:hypothetical protein